MSAPAGTVTPLAPIARAPILCSIDGCKRAGPTATPFLSSAARGSHMRRVHGIASVAMSAKRPDGGTLTCPYPECAGRKPYLTVSGRETHLRVRHGSKPSENPDSVRKRRERDFARFMAQVDKPNADPPPASPATTTHVTAMRALTPGEQDYLRLRLLYVVNGTWAREIDAPPVVIRNEIERLCKSNFAPQRRRRPLESTRA